MPRRFTLARAVVVERAFAYGGGQTRIKFEPAPEIYGTFETRQAAKRMYAEGMDPDLKGSSDEWIARHFAVYVRNKHIRLVRCAV